MIREIRSGGADPGRAGGQRGEGGGRGGGEGGEEGGGVVRKLSNPERGHPPSGLSIINSESTTTAETVRLKFGKLETTGIRLVTCQELLGFFKRLEVERVGTNQIESEAWKMVTERVSKNWVSPVGKGGGAK